MLKCTVLLRACVLAICSLSTCTLAESIATDNKTFNFGVYPYLTAALLDDIYTPASVEMSAALGRNVRFHTSSTHKRYHHKLKHQNYDFALIQPFWFPSAIDKLGYIPLVRMEEPFTALIIVPDSSPLRETADLNGKIIATPPTFAPVVHMARRALIKEGLIPGKNLQFKAFKTVDSCFQQVLIGKADACIAPSHAPGTIEEKMKVRTRVLLKTSSIPNISLVAHNRVPAADREKIKQLFLSWDKHISGQALLKRMRTRRFIPAIDTEYDVVRTLLREINQK